ncbi:TIGR03619 family F420-dependent LLM class oxidoreductase [Specibacter sp. RAF43]|uniref:TIGR03619 family F420-dependent LLM class oxidoreductase n=1 Tax=Specibacter sp. RAF43 TaxID=3233057 RepID=UPI003F960504
MRVSLRIFGFPLTDYREMARAAEVLGFTGIWVPDHVVAMSSNDAKYPYRRSGLPSYDGDTPFADPLVMLSHLAAATERIELGVGVYVLPLRHPLNAARMLLSVQELSHGRLNLGVGVGWNRAEFDSLGEPFEKRGTRAEEMLGVMRRAWAGVPFEHAGDFYGHGELQVSPPLSAPIPILWGGTSEASLKRAARIADGLYCPPGELRATLELRERMVPMLNAQGRDPDSFRFVVRCPEPTDMNVFVQVQQSGFEEMVINVPRSGTSLAQRIEWIETTAKQLRDIGALEGAR